LKNFLLIKKLFFKSFFSYRSGTLLLLNYSKILRGGFLIFAAFDIFSSFFYFYTVSSFLLFSFLNFKNFLYFIVNFSRLQSFYSFTFSNFLLFKAFSTGVLLKYFFLTMKKIRRLVQKQRPIFNFLKKFFFLRLARGCELWVYGFKKKFLPILFELSRWGFTNNFVWVLKKSFGIYQYRRVVAIKKRIRKTINSRVY